MHWFLDIPDARFQIEQFRRDCNERRPHSSLGNRTPDEFIRTLTSPVQDTTRRLPA